MLSPCELTSFLDSSWSSMGSLHSDLQRFLPASQFTCVCVTLHTRDFAGKCNHAKMLVGAVSPKVPPQSQAGGLGAWVSRETQQKKQSLG